MSTADPDALERLAEIAIARPPEVTGYPRVEMRPMAGTVTVDLTPAVETLNSIFAGVREAAAAAGRAFDGLAETLCRSMWPESYRALERARARAERARRIAAAQVRPLVIDGAAYRRRARRRRA